MIQKGELLKPLDNKTVSHINISYHSYSNDNKICLSKCQQIFDSEVMCVKPETHACFLFFSIGPSDFPEFD